jgi:LmbE family N-acetylglucosaminyl deacetylase
MHSAVASRLLDDPPVWSPADGDLLVVAPHPDDEVLGAGGLMRAWAARGAKVNVLSVSDGEAAGSELNEALRKLSPTHVSVTRLGLPDGKIAHHLNRLRNAILSLASAKPTLIAPYERDGHPDHEAVGNMCIEFAHSQRIPIARYAIRAWHRAAPDPHEARWVRFMLSDDARRAKARAVQCFKSQRPPGWGDPSAPLRTLSHFLRPYEAFLL